MKNETVILKEKLLNELESYFGNDTKRINHAKKVLSYAQQLLKEENAQEAIVVAASVLHDVGIKIAEEKYGSSAGRYQEIEGPPVARQILLKNGFEEKAVDEICDIIAHHHSPGKVNTQNFKILYDADWLVNLDEEGLSKDKNKLESIIEKVFLTESGKILAKQIYL